MLKPLAKGALYVLLMFIYLIIYGLLRLGLWRKYATLRFKQWLGKGVVPLAKMSLISRKFRVADVGCVSTEESLDFLKHRGVCYIKRMCLWTPIELKRCILGEQKVREISDDQLVYTLLTSVYGHNLQWVESRACYLLDMAEFDNVVTFKGFYWDARRLYFTPDASKIVIVMIDGQELSSDAEDENEKADYRLAKLHLQVCLSYYAPGLLHNHVHFVYPSAVCTAAKQCLPRDGTLYKLLAPHFRFTEQINFMALRVGNSTDNHRSLMDRFFFFWKSFPVTGEEFVEGVAKHCREYYVDQQAQHKLNMAENSNGYAKGTNCIYPPPYVAKPKENPIPYHDFLRQYYHVIEDFVRHMSKHVDMEEWKNMSSLIAKYIPNFEEVDFVSAVATFIHQASIVHSSDHESFARFLHLYGCMSIRVPYESFSERDAWTEISAKAGYPVESLRRDPSLLVKQMDIMRTRAFANVFGTFVPNPDCDQRIATVHYNFEQAEANEAAAQFTQNLVNLEENLKKQKILPGLGNSKDSARCQGNQLVELNNIVRSISF